MFKPDIKARSSGNTAAPANDQVAALYAAVSPRAVRLAYLITSDHALAEDVVQDAFIRVSSRLTRLRDPNAFEAYLRRSVINEIRSMERSRKRREDRQQKAASIAISTPDSIHADQVHDRVALFQAVSALPLQQRTIILLKYWADLSDAEIADTVDCAIGTVKSRLARGLEALRKAAGDEQ